MADQTPPGAAAKQSSGGRATPILTVLLVVAITGFCWLKWSNDQAARKISGQLAAQSAAIEKLEVALQQQTAVTYAALGKVIPVTMPATFNQQLAVAEQAATQLSQQKHPDMAEVQKNIRLVASLARQLPPWAEQDYLPRLNSLRWLVASEDLLAHIQVGPTTAASRAESWAAGLVRLQLAEPAASAAGISTATLNATANLLAARATDLRAVASQQAYHDDASFARACVRNKNKKEALSAIQRLEPWTAVPTDGHASKAQQSRADDAKRRIRKLRPLAGEWAARRLLARLTQTTALRGYPHAVQAAAVSHVFSEITAIQVGLALRGIPQDAVVAKCESKCRRELASIARRESARLAAAGRNYQEWALKRIARCSRVYDQNHHIFSGSYKLALFAAAKDLLPIEQRYLVPSVQSEYSTVYNKVWTFLAGREDQLQLAKDGVTTKRLSPSEVWAIDHKDAKPELGAGGQ